MADATVKIDNMEIFIKSDKFSHKFMELIKSIEKFNDIYSKTHIDYPIVRKGPIVVDFTKSAPVNACIIKQVKKVIKDTEEVRDEVFKLSDEELIKAIKTYLQICIKAGISDYYRENKIPYRVFQLSGLYSEKNGIRTEKQRRKIRDMLRKCIEFTETEYYKEKQKTIKP